MFEFFELTARGRCSSAPPAPTGWWSWAAPPGTLVPKVPEVPVFYDASYFGGAVRLVAYQRELDRAPAGSRARSVLVRVPRAPARARSSPAASCSAQRCAMGWCWRCCCARLAREVGNRRPEDLTPLTDADLPADVRPLVAAVNQHMVRTQGLVAQQRQFLDDASHQLRTHLTTL